MLHVSFHLYLHARFTTTIFFLLFIYLSNHSFILWLTHWDVRYKFFESYYNYTEEEIYADAPAVWPCNYHIMYVALFLQFRGVSKKSEAFQFVLRRVTLKDNALMSVRLNAGIKHCRTTRKCAPSRSRWSFSLFFLPDELSSDICLDDSNQSPVNTYFLCSFPPLQLLYWILHFPLDVGTEHSRFEIIDDFGNFAQKWFFRLAGKFRLSLSIQHCFLGDEDTVIISFVCH